MNPEKSHHHPNKQKRQFTGCVELIPTSPDFIEFVDAHRIWGFPIRHLTQLILQERSRDGNSKTTPPDQLILIYPTAWVVLVGWRLELMIGPLICGRIVRVHAEKHLGPLIIGEAWVSEIHVLLQDNRILEPEKRSDW
jgi:hypothetical protein